MRVFCHGILVWLRVVSFISLANIANAPQLKTLSVPPLCIGEDLQLQWEYDFSAATAGSITWSFKQSELDNGEIIVASMSVGDWTFQINPDVASRYANRLVNTRAVGSTAGIQISNVSEIDGGKYGINIVITYPRPFKSDDIVDVTLVNVISYVIVPSDSNKVCCNVSNSASLSWNVANKGHPADEEVCKTPTWAELRKDGKVIVEKQRINATWKDVNTDVDLNDRVTFKLTSPFDIRIEPTKLTDSGIYTLIVRYGNFSITSDEIELQVSIPMTISQVADVRQCVGTDVSFPWRFDPGTDCENKIPPVLSISWERQSSAEVDSSIVVANSTPFVPLDPRIAKLESNAGIIVHNVKRSDAGTYEVIVEFQNISLRASTHLTVERRLIPKIVSGSPLTVEMCEGESFAFNWTFKYPDKNMCPYAKVISRMWYLNGNPILADDGDHSTSEEPPSDQTDSPTFSADRSFHAGLAVRNVTWNYSGNYYVKVTFNASDEIVQVSSKNYTLDVKKVPNVIVHSDSNKVCCYVSKSASLSWKVKNEDTIEEQLCKTPTWAGLRKDGKVIVKKQRIDANWEDVDPDVDLNSRVTFNLTSPFDIRIEPTKLTDSGIYTIIVKYGSISITSDKIKLQVSFPMSISYVADIRQCVGTDVSFPWRFYAGTDCEIVSKIVWKKQYEVNELCSIAEDRFVTSDSRITQLESNAGIIIHNVTRTHAAVYEVIVQFKSGSILRASAVLMVDIRLTPEIVSGSPLDVEMCEGESFAFNWTLEYPKQNDCPYAKVIRRSWYLNGELILTKDVDHTTSPSSVTPPNEDPNNTHPQNSSDSDETVSGEGTTVDKTTSITTNTSSATTLPKDVSKASVTGSTKGSTARRGRSFLSDQMDSPTFSFDRRFNAGLAVCNVKSNISGNYSVRVTFNAYDNISIVSSEKYNKLVVMKAHVVSLQNKVEERKGVELCDDEAVLYLRWDVHKRDCNRDYELTWHRNITNQKEEIIGYKRYDEKPKLSRCKWLIGRVNTVGDSSLDIKNLTTNDSGTYIARLTYITDPSVNDSERPELEGKVFSEARVNVNIYNKLSDYCTGKKFSNVTVLITRDGVDVQKSTNATVKLNDSITLSVVLPDEAGLVVAQFFWKEPKHKMLKQFLGKKFRSPGPCSIQFKTLKSLPGIRFQLTDKRREVLFGMKIRFLHEKTVAKETPFYFENHKRIASDAAIAESKLNVRTVFRRRSGTVERCALSGQVFLTAVVFWMLVLHQQRP